MIQNEWEIKSRSHVCSVTGLQFEEGEVFYTLLFREKDGWRREDMCLDAWQERSPDDVQPFSFWKSTYEPPPPPQPEALPRENAEGMLRRFIDEDNPQHARALYILALMLERKKTLRHIETRDADTGPIMIYEHTKTGEIFLIPDPQLRLDQVEEVQMEVSALLDARSPHPQQEQDMNASDGKNTPGEQATRDQNPAVEQAAPVTEETRPDDLTASESQSNG